MDNQLQKYTVRNVATLSVEKIRNLSFITRLPAGAIIEDAIDLLWETMDADDVDRVVGSEW